jgi:hypothetical protein
VPLSPEPENLTLADVYFGRRQTILLKIKRDTIEIHRLQHQRNARLT